MRDSGILILENVLDQKEHRDIQNDFKENFNSNLTKELKGKTVLITGGAGSLGSAITKKLLDYPVKIIRILDIDEYRLLS